MGPSEGLYEGGPSRAFVVAMLFFRAMQKYALFRERPPFYACRKFWFIQIPPFFIATENYGKLPFTASEY